MLQQTQVITVFKHYHNWFDEFPDIQSLAIASLDDVLKAWEGLGYYRRARFIHAAAQQIVTEHGGHFPTEFDDVLALPGIGRSTAGAIASFCFDMNTPVLDGNVKRVLKRWHDHYRASDKLLWSWAQEAIDASGSPTDWNQAMMELGAMVCLPKQPNCAICPVSACCASAFQVEPVNEQGRTVPVRDVHWQVHLHTCPKRGVWLTRRPDSGIWAGLWSPPITECENPPEFAPSHIHQLTHRRLHLYGIAQTSSPTGQGQWVADISQLALPTGIHRLLEKHGVTS